MADDFREKLAAFATRAIQLSTRCTNEESTRLFLILPFLNLIIPVTHPVMMTR